MSLPAWHLSLIRGESFPEEAPLDKTIVHSEGMIPDPNSAAPWEGLWEGYFKIRRNGKEFEVMEEFLLLRGPTDAPKPDMVDTSAPGVGIPVRGGGTNSYGPFELTGLFEPTSRSLVCERAYIEMRRKKRKKPKPDHAPSPAVKIRGMGSIRSSQRLRQVDRHPGIQSAGGTDPPGQEEGLILADVPQDQLAARTTYNTRKRRVLTKYGTSSGSEEDMEEDEEEEEEDSGYTSASASVTTSSTNKDPGYALMADEEDKDMITDKRKKKKTADRTERGAPDNNPSADTDNGWRAALLDEEVNEVYEGEVQDGMREGFGVCVYCAHGNNLYEGEWHKGREHGKGILMTSQREIIYDGDWVDGKIHGIGTYYMHGDSYSGDYRENTRHGRGSYLLASGSRYEGEWRDNQRSGKGRFDWPDGSCYEGDWLQGERHGRGRLHLVDIRLEADGLTYEGQWAKNEFEGRGVCTYRDGQRYEGMWKGGKKEGRGTLNFPNGASYEGRFRNDRIDGQGTLRVPRPVGGACDAHWMIPVAFQSDMVRIHAKAGFDKAGN